jgi:hypothetical protein
MTEFNYLHRGNAGLTLKNVPEKRDEIISRHDRANKADGGCVYINFY